MSNEKKGPVTRLRERIVELEAATKGLKNEYLRAIADFENFRRRMEREIEARQRAKIEALFEDLIPVLDNFERALGAMKVDDAESGLRKGVEMIYSQLCTVLEQHGLRCYSCLGERFDPRRAEAVGFVEAEEGEDNRVVEEVCKGYECSGRVIRPARVKVIKPGNFKPSSKSGESNC